MKVRSALVCVCIAVVAMCMIGCTGAKKNVQEFTVLIRMMPAQQRYFEQEMVAKFNKENNCKITVAPFTDQWDIEKWLKLDASKKQPVIGLVKTPFEATRMLVYKDYMMPLTKVTDMSFQRSTLGRILGYGEFILESAGQDQALRVVDHIPYPEQLYLEVCGLIFKDKDESPD